MALKDDKFRKFPNFVFESKELSLLAKILYCYILNLAGNKFCTASNKTMSKDLGVLPGRISKVVSELNNNGYIHSVVNKNYSRKIEPMSEEWREEWLQEKREKEFAERVNNNKKQIA